MSHNDPATVIFPSQCRAHTASWKSSGDFIKGICSVITISFPLIVPPTLKTVSRKGPPSPTSSTLRLTAPRDLGSSVSSL